MWIQHALGVCPLLERLPRVVVLAASIFALATLPRLARADAIDGPPACPPGTIGRSAHEGRWCVPSPCVEDAACRDGAVCRAWRVCSQTSMVVPGGLRPDDPPPEPRELAIASCAVEAACDGTGEPPPPTVGQLEGTPTCTDGRFCVAPALPALPALDTPPTDPPAGSAGTGGASPSAGPGSAPMSCLCRTTASSSRVPLALASLLALGVAIRAARRRS